VSEPRCPDCGLEPTTKPYIGNYITWCEPCYMLTDGTGCRAIGNGATAEESVATWIKLKDRARHER